MKIGNNLGKDAVMKADKGFTLIELMIVVAIIAILAAIAIPSYQRYVLRTHRSAAMSALQGLAQAMERYYAQAQPQSYVGTRDGTNAPTIFNATSPIDGGAPRYNLRITAVSSTAYTLQAQPVGAQASDGIIQLDSAGRRAWDKNNNGGGSNFEASEYTWSD